MMGIDGGEADMNKKNNNNSLPNDPESDQRIQKTMRQIGHEVGARDLVTFTFGRAWCALLVVASVFVVVVEKWATSSSEAGTTLNGTDS